MKLSITVEFSLDFHQIPQTKHCVISPKNLVIICQRCLCEFGGGQKAQNLDVPTFCNQCINSIRDYGLEFHLKQFYSSHVEKVDSISKQITLNSGIKNRTLQTSIQHCLEFFVQDQNELVQWTFRGNHGKAPDENPGAYIHEGPNASLINELISSVYREKQIWAIAKIIERPDVIEIHSHWPGMIIGRKGALLVELQDVLTNSELGRRTVKAVTLTTPFITPVIPDSARDQ